MTNKMIGPHPVVPIDKLGCPALLFEMSGKAHTAEARIMAKTKGPAHNHVWNYLEGYRTGCPRCGYLKMLKTLAGETQHNHDKTAFGRRVDGCPRCIELANGAPKREGVFDHQNKLEAERTAEIRRHFADPHSTCDHKTCFQW